MPEVKTAILRHRRWKVEDIKRLPLKKEEDLGLCVYEYRILFVPKEGDTELDLDTLVHESLHACTELDETAVDETATSIARLLWRLGWRKT